MVVCIIFCSVYTIYLYTIHIYQSSLPHHSSVSRNDNEEEEEEAI